MFNEPASTDISTSAMPESDTACRTTVYSGVVSRLPEANAGQYPAKMCVRLKRIRSTEHSSERCRIKMSSSRNSLSRYVHIGLVTLLVAFTSHNASAAELRLSRLFSDNMVLQRDQPVTIRGFADAGAKVDVTFADVTKTATADEKGQWSVVLDPMPASATGKQLVCKQTTGDGGTVTLKNVLIGDVFLFARQTSIDVSLARTETGRELAAKLEVDPTYRVMRIQTIPSVKPLADLAPQATDGWSVVDQAAALPMSAVAFHFGRAFADGEDVPIGVIDLNMGSSFTIAWISREAIAQNDEFYGEKTRITGYGKLMDEQLERYEAQGDGPKPEKARDWVDSDPSVDPMFPAVGYNAVLHPMRGIALKAILLQLGNDYPYMTYESMRQAGKLFDREALDTAWWLNYIHRKRGYRAALEVIPRVPALWRAYFGNKQLPMGLIMVPASDNPTYAIHNRETRELQRQTAMANDGVGLILPTMDHIPFSGQPANEVTLSKRCLAWVLADVYQRAGVYGSGPLFDRVEVDYNKAQVFFKEGTAKGLTADAGALDQFEAAGVDKVFSPAKAVIDGQTIRLTSDTVSRIAYVRYNYKTRPDLGLTNNAMLPAIPFRTGEHKFIDVPRNAERNLPLEYTAPASEWEGGEIAIVSGGGASYSSGAGWLGATGIMVRPFGPNMRVVQVLPGAPSAGKVQVGDLIYKVNGDLLEDNHLQHMGRVLTEAETEAGQGKIAFALRRGNDLLDVDIQIEVLGTYSATSPYDCPKADRIVANAEAYLAQRGGLATGYAGGGWLYSDSLFLLGAGTPEHQGLVRRFVYKMLSNVDLDSDKLPPGNAWHRGHAALLLGEYYLATGDRNVLPYLKKYCDALAATQCRPGTFSEMPPRAVGGWRHNYPGGQWYGMIPQIGLPAMIGMRLAKESGVNVNEEAYQRGKHMFEDHQAEMGHVTYAAVMPKYLAPDPIDPEALANGKLYSGNGNRAMSAIFFGLEGDTRIAHLNSMYCTYAFNNTHEGHGSNFFNAMWTPLGAKYHSEKAFINFMREHYWYRDLKRMYNHITMTSKNQPGAGHDLALVAPRERLRMLGAGPSVFAVDAPDSLKPALEAYCARDYAKAQTLAAELTTSGDLSADERTMAGQLQRAATELQQSIAADLAKLAMLIEEDKFYEASLDVPQLTGVMPSGDPTLVSIVKAIDSADAKVVNTDKRRYEAEQKALAFSTRDAVQTKDSPEDWTPLTALVLRSRHLNTVRGMVKDDAEATVWRAKVFEAVSQAPQNWTQPGFDDSQWEQTTLPISWHLNHALLARTTFEIKDKSKIESLRVSCHPFRQLNIVVYINGQAVAKFNECENNGGWVHGVLPTAALKHLANGTNTIAFSTTNDWRWSSRGGVRNGGFGLKIDMKAK